MSPSTVIIKRVAMDGLGGARLAVINTLEAAQLISLLKIPTAHIQAGQQCAEVGKAAGDHMADAVR